MDDRAKKDLYCFQNEAAFEHKGLLPCSTRAEVRVWPQRNNTEQLSDR